MLKAKSITFMGRRYDVQHLDDDFTKPDVHQAVIWPDNSPVLRVREVPDGTTDRDLKRFFQCRQKRAEGKVERIIRQDKNTWLVVFEDVKGQIYCIITMQHH